jgi:site-specific DNA-methyltransferase (adenine-specific)
MHVFGQGFPKSLDVSKAIDARLGSTREVIGYDEDYARRNVNGKYGLSVSGNDNEQVRAAEKAVTAPGSPEAAKFAGWGTALKPAAEHWILVRKPIDGTIAANVLAHGTGGLNIDATRIAAQGRPLRGDHADRPDSESATSCDLGSGYARGATDLGRWPANVTFDEEAAAALGEPSRFFYVSKASRSEREAGLDDLPVKTGGEATDREDGSAGLNSPRAGAGRCGGRHNFHPTVKSIDLMRWLIRLITPPGGWVLDPFMGSGSTGVAAIREGMKFIGIEKEAEYIEIARRRIAHAEEAGP